MAFLRNRFAKGSQDDAHTDAARTSMSRDSSATSIASDPNRKLCIAIIGSGLTGLSASYFLLASDEVASAGLDRPLEVHLFERASKIGLDSNSITISKGTGSGVYAGKAESIRVDVPMRSLNAGYYPNVMALYRRLRIPLKKTDFTYSFSSLLSPATGSQKDTATATPPHHAPSPSLLYEGSSGLKGFSIPHALRSIPRIRTDSPGSRSASLKRHDLVASPFYTLPFYSISLISNAFGILQYALSIIVYLLGYLNLVFLAIWSHYSGYTRDPSHPLASRTLQSHFPSDKNGRTNVFLDQVVVPLFSAMMTVQASSVLSTPIAEVFDYVALTFGRSHYTVAAGVHEVEEVISRPMEKTNIHVDCEVTSLTRNRGRIDVEVSEGGEEAVYEGFDHVILATQANQSAAFVASYLDSPDACAAEETKRLQKLLRQLQHFTYEDSEVINHVDRSLLPREEQDWRDLNLVTPQRRSNTSAEANKAITDASEGQSTSDESTSDSEMTSTLSTNTHTMASHIIHHSLAPSSSATSSSAISPSSSVLIQTTNPLAQLRPADDKVISASHFERAVLTLRSKAGQAGLFEWRRKDESDSTGKALAMKSQQSQSSQRSLVQSAALAPISFVGSSVSLMRRCWTQGTLTTLGGAVRARLPVEQWELRLGDLQGRGQSGGGRASSLGTQEGEGEEKGGDAEAEADDVRTPGIWACGSWSPGIPLLEGCVTSSKLVVEALLREEAQAQARAQAQVQALALHDDQQEQV
ncbi:hypothetical protein BCV69DRAFT_299097 [Microstroma glucosiphilum]|uniref:Amine oxidase domain-containing protein n=1 Tax=Pseudomicrostroma glucosiphilum TaxID=1684307 RepID=A0A316UC84_9BASI|nr:hypothetical protein BCV69DRAFT_299097 [Pseudomicrostroma glucosiphilum]PWN20615.1 hypothetical protein BCV69DRAFT_299097 [Pseudomicrostroma glucosiphilum]